MTMKRSYLFLAIAPLLASCGTTADAKAVNNLSDFVEVASSSQIKISFASAIENAITGTEKPSTGITSRAFYYLNDDYRIETPTKNRIGYSLATDKGVTQYCLIDTKTKAGKIHATGDALNDDREATIAELRRQYDYLAGVYDTMKGYVGKSASQLGYSRFEFRRSVAPEVAGYVVLTTKIETGRKIETNYYLMMDKIGGVWAFTNYNVRETVYNLENHSWVVDHYDVSQYQITVVEEYSKIAINLSNYSLTVEGTDISDVSYDDDSPLTPR